MSVDITIRGLDELTADIERLRKDSSFRWPKEILDTSAEMLRDAIVDEAPGSIKDTVVIEATGDTRRVVVESPHAVFVNDGTRPSPGRYVPAIGKRLVATTRVMFGVKRLPSGVRVMQTRNIGMHPGTKATHFFDRGVRFATSSILGYVHRKLYEYLLEI